MTREEKIELIAMVLVAHDVKELGTTCVCGKKLYTADGVTSMSRHRAEKIAEELGL